MDFLKPSADFTATARLVASSRSGMHVASSFPRPCATARKPLDPKPAKGLAGAGYTMTGASDQYRRDATRHFACKAAALRWTVWPARIHSWRSPTMCPIPRPCRTSSVGVSWQLLHRTWKAEVLFGAYRRDDRFTQSEGILHSSLAKTL